MTCVSSEDVRRQVLEIKAENEENKTCSDCGRVETRECMVEWVSVFRGVFVCIECAGIHRRPRDEVPIVRSIRLDTWNTTHLEMMRGKGNRDAKMKWEVDIPVCWVKPWPHQCPYALREQWIEAKYTRKEFTKDAADNAPRRYLTGEKQGYLKKKKLQVDSDVYQDRWFVISNGVLSYYRDRKGSPKDVISLLHVNVALHVPEVAKNNIMLIIFYNMERKKTRNIFVMAENSFEIIDWFLVIRQAKIKLLRQQYGDIDDDIAREQASQEIIHYGWMHKTSPNGTRMKERFFVLDGKCLRYYSSPKSAFPLGELVLGSPNEGYRVDDNVPEGMDCTASTFMLHVPERARGGYPLQAPDTVSKKQWMSILTDVIESTRATPEVIICLPFSYDDDMDTLRRQPSTSESVESSASRVHAEDHRDSSASSRSASSYNS